MTVFEACATCFAAGGGVVGVLWWWSKEKLPEALATGWTCTNCRAWNSSARTETCRCCDAGRP